MATPNSWLLAVPDARQYAAHLSVCLSISDTVNNQQSITIHSIEIAALNSLLTPNHSPNWHISQVPEPYALRSNVGASAQFCLGLTKMSAWYKK